MFETVTANIINPAGGTTTLDADYQPVYVPSAPIVITGATFTQLTSVELVARSQLQDDSQFKLRITDNTLNRTINHTFTVTIDSVVYKINGKPKVPVQGNGRITIYLSKI